MAKFNESYRALLSTTLNILNSHQVKLQTVFFKQGSSTCLRPKVIHLAESKYNLLLFRQLQPIRSSRIGNLTKIDQNDFNLVQPELQQVYYPCGLPKTKSYQNDSVRCKYTSICNTISQHLQLLIIYLIIITRTSSKVHHCSSHCSNQILVYTGFGQSVYKIRIAIQLISFTFFQGLLRFFNLLLLESDEIVDMCLQLVDFVHLLGVVVLQPSVLLLLEILQPLELGIKFIVPGVEHHHLERKSTAAHDETYDWQILFEENHLTQQYQNLDSCCSLRIGTFTQKRVFSMVVLQKRGQAQSERQFETMIIWICLKFWLSQHPKYPRIALPISQYQQYINQITHYRYCQASLLCHISIDKK